MNIIKTGNSAFAFLLELSALVILGFWGFALQSNKIISVTFALLVPMIMVAIWRTWCAPSSSDRLKGWFLILLKLVLFGIVVCCLLNMQQISIAVIFGCAVILNLGLSSFFATRLSLIHI